MASNKMRAIHPGEILREEYLGPQGLSANALALALHVQPRAQVEKALAAP
jgi:plasmid maintenance system antidote protein VapI